MVKIVCLFLETQTQYKDHIRADYCLQLVIVGQIFCQSTNTIRHKLLQMFNYFKLDPPFEFWFATFLLYNQAFKMMLNSIQVAIKRCPPTSQESMILALVIVSNFFSVTVSKLIINRNLIVTQYKQTISQLIIPGTYETSFFSSNLVAISQTRKL